MKINHLKPTHVAHLPDFLEEGVLYICLDFDLAAHLCCCGCGEEVITQLNSARWTLTESNGCVTLSPSIGNWKFSCKSHYWIESNKVICAEQFSPARIKAVINNDSRELKEYVSESSLSSSNGIFQRAFQRIKSFYLLLIRFFMRWYHYAFTVSGKIRGTHELEVSCRVCGWFPM